MNRRIPITDFFDPQLDVYARRTENQLINREHPEEGMFIAESPKVIRRALDAGYQALSFLVEDRADDAETQDVLALAGDAPVYTASLEVLTQLTGFQLTRGLLCAMRRPPHKTVAEVCKNARRVAVLENVMNPTNVGAIFRSAAALNMDAVLLTPACSDPLYRRAIRVSMGTVFQVPWTYLPPSGTGYAAADLSVLKELGFQTAAMALNDDSISIRDPRLQQAEKLAIVLGTEGDGLANSTVDGCDYTVKIPMTHGVDSLNVAAASAVAFWQLGNGEE
jgi:tRNA G18 (ribose-2'-O)-methylase SpoU